MTVENLLNGDIDKRYNDKLFWYASKVIISKNHINIFVEKNNLVTFDHESLPYKKLSEIKAKISLDKNIIENVLIASGSFLFINNKLLVTQRNYKTKYDPGFWTTPAGRCDRGIYFTAIKETIEEIEIRKNNILYYPNLAEPYVTDTMNIKFYTLSLYNENISLKTQKVNLYLENNLIESCNAWFYFSKKSNTIEFRIPMFSSLNENQIEFNNPEFRTATGLKTFDELRKLQCVPALKQLLEEI